MTLLGYLEIGALVTARWRDERVSADADSLLERLRLVMPLGTRGEVE